MNNGGKQKNTLGINRLKQFIYGEVGGRYDFEGKKQSSRNKGFDY